MAEWDGELKRNGGVYRCTEKYDTDKKYLRKV